MNHQRSYNPHYTSKIKKKEKANLSSIRASKKVDEKELSAIFKN